MTREIISVQHPLVKHLVRVRLNKDYREEHQSVLIEGPQLIREVCPHMHTKVLLVTDFSQVPKGLSADEIICVSEQVLNKISGLQASEGLLAEVALPKSASLAGKKWVVAFDGVSDPGNTGTLIRSALALGWEGVFILDNSCDPFNDKALRAAKGATFRIPLAKGSWSQLQHLIEESKLLPLVAHMHGPSIEDISLNERPVLLVLSNEARGISPEATAACQKVSIPMQGEMESLNVAVAGGILMYLLKGSCYGG